MRVRFNGTFNEFDASVTTNGTRKTLVVSSQNNYCDSLANFILNKKDVTVDGDDFTRSYHLISIYKDENGRTSWEYVCE